MDYRLRNFYLESTVNNASPGQLLVMLYEALVQHAEAADAELSSTPHRQDRGDAAHAVARCLDILSELTATLRPEVNSALCASLNDLYRFFAHELSHALEDGRPERIRAILPLLQDLKSTWNKAFQIAGRGTAVAA
jgi:flagellar protein FliS